MATTCLIQRSGLTSPVPVRVLQAAGNIAGNRVRSLSAVRVLLELSRWALTVLQFSRAKLLPA